MWRFGYSLDWAARGGVDVGGGEVCTMTLFSYRILRNARGGEEQETSKRKKS